MLNNVNNKPIQLDCTSRFMPYERTGLFSGLVVDYLNSGEAVRSFYSHPPNLEGIRSALAERKAFDTDRTLICEVFSGLYGDSATELQQEHIRQLASPTTFTICTAHQPNIFTGYLYFVYKILHTIRLASFLEDKIPGYQFVPVYYMGSEDNDLEELGQVKVDGVKMEWKTKQQGAVGRMKVDKALLQLIAQLEGQLGVQPYGQELISILRDSYREGTDIASATFRLVNHLFASYGLLVLVADDPRLKRKMEMVFREDLFSHVPHALVNKSGEALQSTYKVQVNPREINLFYLNEGLRERIVEDAGLFKVEHTNLRFTHEEIKKELAVHPERFSPNVVLRALYQETILPNVAFIGGGAEVAYWLEMKGMFDHYQVPFPVLVLRNSFLVGEKAQDSRLASFGFKMEDLFLPEFEMMNKYVAAHSANTLDVTEESTAADQLLSGLKKKAAAVDQTLLPHVEAIHARFQKQLNEAGKKLLRAEKRKFDDQRNQLLKIKAQLFPNGSLQERVDNFMPYYAQHGKAFIDALYKHSPALEQEFIILIDSLAN